MNVRYTRTALADLDEILDYIARDNPIAAATMVIRVRTAITMLSDFPRIGRQGQRAGTLELIVPNTPFIVVYRIANDEIQILNVFHGAQERD